MLLAAVSAAISSALSINKLMVKKDHNQDNAFVLGNNLLAVTQIKHVINGLKGFMHLR